MGECTLCSSNLTQHVLLPAHIIFGAFLAAVTVYYDGQDCDEMCVCVCGGVSYSFWALLSRNIIKRFTANVRRWGHVVDSGPDNITNLTVSIQNKTNSCCGY